MNAPPPRVEALPVSLKAGWAVGALGVAILLNGIGALSLFYMVSILGIEPAIAGGLIFATKILDMLIDPAIGMASDRTRSRFGRRRPWLFVGALLSALSFLAFFAPPAGLDTPALLTLWAAGALVAYTLGYSLFNVPYMAMPAEMTDSYHERSSIHAWRIVFVSLGGFLAAAMAPVLLEALGKGERSSYATVGVIGGTLILATTMATVLLTGRARSIDRGPAVVGIAGELGALWANKYFLRLISVKLAQLIGVFATQAAMIFFLVNALKLDLSILGAFGAAMTVSTIATAPLLVRFSKRYGKREAYIVAGSAYILYSLSWLLASPGEPVWALVLRGLVVGVAAGGNVILAMSMLTDIIEWDARRTGVRREGVYAAVYSFVENGAAAFGPLVIGFALSLAGFEKGNVAAAVTPRVEQALLLGMVYIPVAMGALAIVLLLGYRLTEAQLRGDAARQVEKSA
ncbi:MFS transporter [Sandaracinobacteroides saxicola]|uniref:MFS transporter n=1 Tax=Sandaracinobacteroides saxicola TaxID=2759707 RepID=A0A7G5IJR4_9SPHN|nr:MFS transporter [Sandaracinobacteroides saxicola]QMW23606.1 MFS transporter [Sandaracinobacteroides saxicola]